MVIDVILHEQRARGTTTLWARPVGSLPTQDEEDPEAAIGHRKGGQMAHSFTIGCHLRS
jgi:hypothetical protein